MTVLRDDELDLLAKSLEGNTNLKALHLYSKTLGHWEARQIAAAIAKSGLERLELSIFETDPSRSGAMRTLYLEGVLPCTTLRQLTIGGRIGKPVWLAMAGKGLSGITIQTPSPQAARVPDGHFADVCHSLTGQLAHLRQLKFGYMRMSAARMRVLSEGLRGNTSLVELSLHHCYLQDHEAEELVRDWGEDHRLQTLRVELNPISDRGAIALLQASSTCTSLQRISLRGSALVDEDGLARIARELCQNRAIRWRGIDLSDCILDSAGGRTVRQPGAVAQLFTVALKANRNIFDLRIDGNGMEVGRGVEGKTELLLAGALNICHAYDMSAPCQPGNRGGHRPFIWCHMMASRANDPTWIYWSLLEQPNLTNQRQYS